MRVPVDGVTIDVQLSEKFAGLYQPFRHKAFHGGRGGAKSHSIGEALVIHSAQRELRIVGARQFQNSIRDSSKELIEKKIYKFGLQKKFWIGKSEIINESTGSRFTFIGLDRNPDSARSLEGADICWVEEARNISQTSIDTLIPTIRKPKSEIWWSWNPVDPKDPVDALLRGPVPPKNLYIREVDYLDNPWFFNTEMPEEMERLREADQALYEHVWLGAYYNRSKSRIFTNYRVGFVDVPDYAIPQFGLDFGFSQDPNALIKLYVIEDKRQIYIAREAFGNVSLRDLPEFVADVPESTQFTIVGDSARPETIDYLNGFGFSVVGARKGPGSIKAGIEWLQGYEVVISPECPRMEEEARLYSWAVDKLTKKILNVPVDAFNHGWDAIRYATEVNRDGGGVQLTTVKM